MMKKYFFVFFLLAVFFMPGFVLAKDFEMEKIFYMSQLQKKEGFESLKKNYSKIDILAPQFYALTPSLTISGGLSYEIKRFAAEKKIKVMPLIANSGFRQDIIHNLLISEKAQDNVVKGLVYLAKKNNYIGWQFDFENISYKDRDLFSAFVEKTYKAFLENELVLSVASVSRTSDYEDTNMYKNWSGVFDYERIAKSVDFISLMTYDDPNSVGPVASLPFIKKVLIYVKGKIPPEKISMGIPLYYWGWSVEPFKKIVQSGTSQKLSYIKSNFNYTAGFSEALGSSWLSYFWENKQYLLWFQNKKTIESKLDIIKQNKLRGFSAWVLGVEELEIWSALK